MTATIGYIVELACYLGLIAAMAAVVAEAWREAREREQERQRRACGDMYVSKEGM